MSDFKVINVHAHLHSPDEYDKKRGFWEKELGYVRVCLCATAPEWGMLTNDDAERVMRAHPDFVVGFGYVRPDHDDWEKVAELYERGFRGLKILYTEHGYFHEPYFPIYARAEELGLPILFHTGFVAPLQGVKTVMWNLHPCHLGDIAKHFPNLRMIGAHLGGPWYHEAVYVAQTNENVYFDLSGGTVRYFPIAFLRSLFERVERNMVSNIPHIDPKLLGKIVYGSDNPDDTLEFYLNMLNALGIEGELREKVLWKNMAEILGIDV